MSIVGFAFNQSITSISSYTINEYNDKTLTAIHHDVKCRWQEKVVQATNRAGEEITSKVQMWIMPEITVEEGYRVEKDSTTYVIVAYEKQYNLEGVHDHTKTYLN